MIYISSMPCIIYYFWCIYSGVSTIDAACDRGPIKYPRTSTPDVPSRFTTKLLPWKEMLSRVTCIYTTLVLRGHIEV
jgi:hypothetical protein